MQKYRTSEGDTADLIAWKRYGTQSGRVVEQLLAANPGLSDRGPTLPAGLIVQLPEIQQAEQSGGVKLWD